MEDGDMFLTDREQIVVTRDDDDNSEDLQETETNTERE